MSQVVEPDITERSRLLNEQVHSAPPSRKCSVASVSRIGTPFVRSAEDWAKRDRESDWIWYNDLFFIGPIVIAGSLLVGILFYKLYNGWTIGSATFCATATLIGAIYDVPNQPDDVGAAFTILYYVYGISLFTAIIGAIIGSMITRAPLISAEARRRIAKMEQPEDTDGDGEIGFYDYFYYLYVRLLDLLGWEDLYLNYLVTSAALAWVALGVLYGVYVEGWEVNHSIYFAMNAVSMAALADPPCEDGEPYDCDVGFYRGLMMSLYLITGVPLFTLALAQLAGLVINRAVRENEYKIMHQPLTQDEYNYAANLYGNDEVLSLGEFTVLELLRLQRVSMEDLEHIKNLFCAIDEAATGMVDKPMLAKRNLIHNYGAVMSPEVGAGRSSGGRQRERTVSGESMRNLSLRRMRSRSRSRSFGSAAPIVGLGAWGRWDSPPVLKVPSVILDEEEGTEGRDTAENEKRSSPPDSWEDGQGGGDGFSEGGGSSIAAPDIPLGIKRMTIGQYNELVVPLAFTTLIENYEEEVPPDEQEGPRGEDGAEGRDDEGDVSSCGFNTAAEDDRDNVNSDNWPSDGAGYRYGGREPSLTSLGAGMGGRSSFRRRASLGGSSRRKARGAGLRSRLSPLESEREDGDDEGEEGEGEGREDSAPCAAGYGYGTLGRAKTRSKSTRSLPVSSSRKGRGASVRRVLGLGSSRKDNIGGSAPVLSDMEKGGASES